MHRLKTEVPSLLGELGGGDHHANVGRNLVDEGTWDTRRSDYGDHGRDVEARISLGERREVRGILEPIGAIGAISFNSPASTWGLAECHTSRLWHEGAVPASHFGGSAVRGEAAVCTTQPYGLRITPEPDSRFLGFRGTKHDGIPGGDCWITPA